jgi:hypothetical protein
MRKILFVDHAMHSRTHSSAFFTDLLERRFAVTRLFVTPDRRHAFDWRFVAEFDIVVLWQLDFLAPLFLAHGHRTVVLPMYDGSGVLPQVHWASAVGARFVNFSRTLHERVRLIGLDSLLVKYFSEAVAEAALPEFDSLRVFLWQRRPEDGINAELAGKLFGNQMHSLHIHNVPDNPSMATKYAPPTSIGAALVTVSEWFQNRADYDRVLETCNVFVCPRAAEGIGMAMVEAMARGLLVVANDLPCHNEYICNWLNGVLFNSSHVGWADFSTARSIARMGWRTAREGHARWCASAEHILAFIAGTPRYAAAAPEISAELERDLVPAYLAGGEIYERFLLKMLPSLHHRQLADATTATALARDMPSSRGRADRPVFPVVVVPSQTTSSASVVLGFGGGAARPLLRSGWSVDEAFGVWIEGVQADLGFTAAIGFPVAAVRLRIVALAPGEGSQQPGFGVTVNGLASSGPLAMRGGGPRELHCDIVFPAAISAQTWHLEFCCDRTLSATGDARRLSVAIIALEIDFLPASAVEVASVLPVPPPPASIPWQDGQPGPREAAAAALDAVVRKAARRRNAASAARSLTAADGDGRTGSARDRADTHEKV